MSLLPVACLVRDQKIITVGMQSFFANCDRTLALLVACYAPHLFASEGRPRFRRRALVQSCALGDSTFPQRTVVFASIYGEATRELSQNEDGSHICDI
jgi:hypothetical protein